VRVNSTVSARQCPSEAKFHSRRMVVLSIAANAAHHMTWCRTQKLCINCGEGQSHASHAVTQQLVGRALQDEGRGVNKAQVRSLRKAALQASPHGHRAG
jgi:hypothetical protein